MLRRKWLGINLGGVGLSIVIRILILILPLLIGRDVRLQPLVPRREGYLEYFWLIALVRDTKRDLVSSLGALAADCTRALACEAEALGVFSSRHLAAHPNDDLRVVVKHVNAFRLQRIIAKVVHLPYRHVLCMLPPILEVLAPLVAHGVIVGAFLSLSESFHFFNVLRINLTFIVHEVTTIVQGEEFRLVVVGDPHALSGLIFVLKHF